jgi:hypothetical protein
MIEKINLNEIRKEQADKLEELLSSPKKVEEAAKRLYGNRWQIIYSGENHPQNKSKR